ncbi:MAG: hypothetical protein KF689_11435 [Gemmatimonadaceae bacterium]|nr:hypothetical protein [Gemmatimonadaceae bacterium]MCW5825791.1 hypothetical protein [Gemmatimonadaceae bacterium]
MRLRGERLLSVTALTLLATLAAASLWSVWRPGPTQLSSTSLASGIERLSGRAAPARVHLRLDSLPDAVQRDRLASIARAGTSLTWESTRPWPRIALSMEPVADPRRPLRVSVARLPQDAAGVDAPPPALVDSGGTVADLILGPRGGSVELSVIAGFAELQVIDGGRPRALVEDSLVLRPVLVLGNASWEGKFVLAALEELGWPTDARLTLAPRAAVRQAVQSTPPSALRLDTARYAAVIVTDAAADLAVELQRYVAAGGGLILLPDAARQASFARLRVAQVSGPAVPARPMSSDSVAPRRALAFSTLKAGSRADAIELRDGQEAVVAGHVGGGRVIQLGYSDTWRWRMGGPVGSEVEHREWWGALVSQVAYAPRITLARAGSAWTHAPLASFERNLGSAAPLAESPYPDLESPGVRLAFVLLFLASALCEWASRRLRGKR